MKLIVKQKKKLFGGAICKSRNRESGNGIRGMMGTQRIRVGTWGIRVGTRKTRGIKVGMREMGVGMLRMRGMQGIRVEVYGIGLGMRRIRVGMCGIWVGMQGIRVRTRGIGMGMRGIEWNSNRKKRKKSL